MLNTTIPANTDVQQFVKAMNIASLWQLFLVGLYEDKAMRLPNPKPSE